MVKIDDQKSGEGWFLYKGDSCEVLQGLDDDSVHLSVFSPPFASLYTYSSSPRDLGNCATHEQFHEHYRFIARELTRVVKPGRIVAVHCMDLPTSKARDGYIGVSDFPGELIRAHEREGLIFHSRCTIWKDPVTSMQRTKALGLLHKQIKKDSCMSRTAIPDYLLAFRKPGKNPEPVAHTDESFPVERWQRWASPIWVLAGGDDGEGFQIPHQDINPSDTLQHRSARDHADERHIAPLQLEVIRRAVRLWSNPGDVVLSPFAGIGSEGYVALEEKRRFIGIELKRSYYEQACRNLASVGAQLRIPG